MHITRRETLEAERAELLAELPGHTLRHDPRVHRLQEINAELALIAAQKPRPSETN